MGKSGCVQALAFTLAIVFVTITGHADSFEAQRSYTNVPAAKMYAAELQAAGSALKRSVERSCTVQFQINESAATFYRVMNWTAVCHDAGNGSTNVTLAVQMQSTIDWGNDEAKQKAAAEFWSHLDAALGGAATTSSPVPSASPALPAPAPANNSAATGVAHIASEPAGADIEVDGEYAGNTPSDLKLKAGSHSLKVSKKGFSPWQRTIKIEAGESRSFNAELQK